jgi:hypothetical protein
MVLPDWKYIGDELAATLAGYVAGGGKLILCGAENASLLSSALNLKLKGSPQEHGYFVADETGFAQVAGSWVEIDAQPAEILATAYRTSDTRKDMLPLAVGVKHGKGSVVVCPGPIMTAYGNGSTPILRSILRPIAAQIHAPMVRLDGEYPSVEMVLRRKNGQMLVHLINLAGMPDTGEFRHTGVVPRTGAIGVRMRLPNAPGEMVLEPEGTKLAGRYEAGEWIGTLPDLHVHSMIRVALKA